MKRKNVVLLLLVTLIGALLPLTPSIQDLENSSVDARFRVRGPIEFGPDVVVVAIDDATDDAWRGVPKAFWLSPIAELCSLARLEGAKAIGLDMIVSVDLDEYLREQGFADAPNQRLYEEVKAANGVLFIGTSLDDPQEEARKYLDLGSFLSINTMQADRSVIRMLPRWDTTLHPNILGFANGLAAIERARYDPIDINFSGSEPKVISAIDLLYGLYDEGSFEGKIVLIGETYTQSQDTINTPFQQGASGVMVHAEAIETLLRGRELHVVPVIATIVTGLLLGLASGYASYVFSIGKYVGIALVLAALWAGGAQWLFASKFIVVPVVAPMLAFLLVSPLCVFAVKAIDERHERLWARSQWGQMVSDEFVAVLEAKRNANLGSIETFTAALLFLDVAGFSEKSNRLSSQQVVQGLNQLLEPVIGHVNRHGGTVLNFIGDGVVAMFHSSENGEHFSSRAVRAALAVLDSVDKLNTEREGGEKWNLRMGIAVGDVSLALVGSKDRKQMTVYGSAVNMAARLEQAGKSLDTRLALTEELRSVADSTGRTFEQYRIMPKGWDEEVEVLALRE